MLNMSNPGQHQIPYGDDGLVINTRLIELQRQQAEDKKRDEEFRKQQLDFNKLLTWFTGGLLLVSFLSEGVIVYQTKLSKVSSDAATVAAEQAKRAADIADAGLRQSKESMLITLADNR